MKTKLFNKHLFFYEIRNLLGQPLNLIFGFAFPTIMGVLFANIFIHQVPKSEIAQLVASMYVGYALVVPLAILLVGFPALFSQEIEKNVIIRLNLFGYFNQRILMAKLLANFTALSVSFIIFTIAMSLLTQLTPPSLLALVVLTVTMITISILLFLLAYAISMLTRRFAVTYAITMSLYFLIMILAGLFGVRVDDMPNAIQYIAKLFPTTYMASDIPTLWVSGITYNFGPMLQSFIFFTSLVGIILIISLRKNRRITAK